MARTGGELIVDALVRAGVRHAFGIAGVHNLPIYDAIHDQDALVSFATRHEQGAAYMADGYARASGRPGVALVTTGPGLTNTVTPLAGAWSDSVPLLVIGTAGELPLLGKYKGYLHEFKDQSGVMAAAAGTRLVTRAADLEQATLEELTRMQTGRPRPTALEVPIDVLEQTADVAPAPLPPIPPPQPPSEESVARTADLLRRAKYPLLFAGGGVARADASDVLLRLAERLRAPVLTTISGKGAIPDTSLWSAGCTWRTSSGPTDGYPALWRQADVGLVVGNRLTGMATRAWRLPLPPTLAHLDLDASEMGKSYPVAERLVGDARLGLEMLLAALEDTDSASRWNPHDVRAARDADDDAGEAALPRGAPVGAGAAGRPAPGGHPRLRPSHRLLLVRPPPPHARAAPLPLSRRLGLARFRPAGRHWRPDCPTQHAGRRARRRRRPPLHAARVGDRGAVRATHRRDRRQRQRLRHD